MIRVFPHLDSSEPQCSALLSYNCYLFYSFKSLDAFNKMYKIRKSRRQHNPILYTITAIQDLCCKPTFLLIGKKKSGMARCTHFGE